MRKAYLLLLVLLAAVSAARALTPDQLLLVVNKNDPDGQALADHYATARQVPADRIVALDVPKGDDLPFDTYERNVVPVIRAFLREHQLDRKVTCLVTFRGVPLRLPDRKLTEAEKQEVAKIHQEIDADLLRIDALAAGMEAKALSADPAFKAVTGQRELPVLEQRIDAASRPMLKRLATADDPQLGAFLQKTMEELAGPAGVLRSLKPPAGDSAEEVAEKKRLAAMAQQVRSAQEQIRPLNEKRYDADARAKMREIVRGTFGLFDHARVLSSQLGYLATENSTAALDSELALLWWDYYPRGGHLANPLHYAARAGGTPPTMMVCRLDAPQADLVKKLIDASVKTETDGLKGMAVLDARGKKPGADPYGSYDQTIRNLSALLKAKTKVQVLLEDTDQLLPANCARDVALYCGWYSLHHYVACCKFNPGAVGFHIASSELLSMNDKEAWVPGLLQDGIAATLGPVAEPYLFAFPAADEFFPLLMTGKLSLAEVFWRTELVARWRVTMVGDPLYTPYKNAPALRPEDLPPKAAAALKGPASRPVP